MRRYFEEEMRYLQEAGKAYAEVHPETARYLNVDSVSDRDPYVERLFEGFAFLAGRIHERIDDEMPVYTEALCSLLFPHLLKSIPALTLMEFRPRRGLVRGTMTIERGTEVRSGPVGEERATCRFRTTQAVRIQPIQLNDVTLSWSGDMTSSVRLTFAIEKGTDLSAIAISPLRLHFLADASTAATMHLFFTRHARVVRLTSEGVAEPVTLRAEQAIAPGGFDEDEGLLPYGPNVPASLRLMQEYLCFRRKFWCVDLLGLDRLKLPAESAGFSVDVQFDAPYPENRRFLREHVRLYCAPAVNLFSSDAEPIRVEHFDAEYHVSASARYRRSVSVYDVESVVGLEDGTAKRNVYEPYFAFRHGGRARAPRLYQARRRLGPLDRLETYLTLSGAALEDPEKLVSETLSLQVLCTNGSLPRERLQEGSIDRLAPEAPQVVDVTNLTQPTLNLDPPLESQDGFYWQLVSHWSFNYLSVASREALLGILALYDWSESDANKRRFAGIVDVKWKPRELPHRGAVIRGAEVIVTVQDGYFDDGELNLFGLILSRFLSLYATINSFVHLSLVLTPSGKHYEWRPPQGHMPTL